MKPKFDIKDRLREARSTVSGLRGFREFQLGTIGFVLGTGLLATVITIYMRYVRNISILEIGIIFSVGAAVRSALTATLQFSFGGASERFGRKSILVFCFMVLGLLIPLYALAVTPTDFLVLLSVQSAISSIIEPTSNAFLGDIAPEDSRARVFSMFGFITNIFYVVSLFMTLILKVIDVSLLFLISGSFVIIATILMLRIKQERVPAKVKDEQGKREKKPKNLVSGKIRQGIKNLKSVAKDRGMLGITLNFVFFNLALGIYPTYFPLLVLNLGADPAWTGPMVAISWLTFAIAQPYGGSISDRLGRRKSVILYGLLFAAITNLAMGFMTTLLLVVVFWGLIGIGDGISRPVRLALVVDKVKEKRGLAFGTIWALSTIVGILMPSAYAYLVELGTSRGMGYSLAYSLATVLLLLSALSIAVLVKEEGRSDENKSVSQISS